MKTDRRALIPRPETEYLLELIVAKLPEPPKSILDLGTGSGAIALGLANHFPLAQVTAVDVSAVALELARENATATGFSERVTFLLSDWFSQVDPTARFDLIVANPPYLSETEVAAAEPEVRDFDPKAALTPGGDGSTALTAILAKAREHLADHGLLALETGIGQHAALLGLSKESGFTRAESAKDLTGRDRFIFAWPA